MTRRDPKTEAEVLTRLAKDTGLAVTEAERLDLWNETYLFHATQGEYADCLKYLRKLRGRTQGRRARGRSPVGAESFFKPVGTPEEFAQARVLSGCLARFAEEDWWVGRTRKHLTGGGRAVLDPKHARKVLRSPALHYLRPEFFRGTGVPPRDHTSRIVGTDFSFDRESSGMLERVTLELKWKGGRVEHTEEVPRGDRHGHTPAYLEYPDRDSRLPRLDVRRGAWLWPLLTTARGLARRFSWGEADATWFLLTGTVPSLYPAFANYSMPVVDAQQGSDWAATPLPATIVIRALPFASVETVSRAYSAARRFLRQRRKGRPMSPRNLKLFEFVEELRAAKKRDPEWPELMQRWNHEVEKDAWQYSDWRNFRRAYLRIRGLVLEARFPE